MELFENKDEVKVVHCKKEDYDVYIGRGSKWGNPFSHLKTSTQAKHIVESRDVAIDSYREYILNGDGKHLLKDLHKLKGKTLGCWCGNFTKKDKKLKCHGQILMELVHNL